MCGDKISKTMRRGEKGGSPPHVRGQALGFLTTIIHHRITPACAGTSLLRCGYSQFVADHPRMCGDKSTDRVPSVGTPGSPPHVRGQAHMLFRLSLTLGITPACAGTSCVSSGDHLGKRDHPRMCGDKHACFFWFS